MKRRLAIAAAIFPVAYVAHNRSAQLKLGLVLYKVAIRLNPAIATATVMAAEQLAQNMVVLRLHQDEVGRRARRQ